MRRAPCLTHLIQGIEPGGQLTITTDVENYPGFADVIQGPWLMEQMAKQATHVGTRLVADHVTKVQLARRPFRLECDSGDVYFADALVLATGAQARWLDLPSERKFRGYGVSACATCDGFFYRDKEVLVIGGGNTAVEEALFLTNFATKVTLVHRRDRLRSERILQERLFANPKISVLWDTVLEDVLGDEQPPKVRAAVLRNVKTGDISERPVDGIFIAIGHAPASQLVAGQIEMKPSGYVKISVKDLELVPIHQVVLSACPRRGRVENHSAAMRGSASPCAARNFSASSAAMQPSPAAVTACR